MSIPAARKSARRSPSKPAAPTPMDSAHPDDIQPTPRRSGRAATPRAETKLPGLTSKSSNAYGGATNMPLAHAMSGDTAKTTFAAALQKRREEVAQRDEPEESEEPEESTAPTPRSKRTPARSKKTANPVPIAEEEEEPAPKPKGRSAKSKASQTVDDVAIGYSILGYADNTFTAETHAANGSGRTPATARGRRLVNTSTHAIPDFPEEVSIDTLSHLESIDAARRRNRPSRMPGLLLNLMGGLGLLLFLATAYSVAFPHLPESVQELPVYGKTGVVKVGHWLSSFGSSSQNGEGLPWDLTYQLETLANQIVQLREAKTLHENTFDELREVLPNAIILNRDKHGNYAVPDHFWTALKSKTSSELGISVDDSLWEQFLKRNQADLDRILGNTMNEHLTTAIRNKIIVSPETFETVIRDNYASLNEELDKATRHMNSQLSSIQSTASKTATDVSHAVIKDTLKALPQAQLHSIAEANLLKNMADAMSSVNYFSRSLGAIIDPNLSSPTQLVPFKTRGLGGFLNHLFGKNPANPPVSALEPWQEHGDCWCAARTSGPLRRPEGADSDFEPFAPKAQLAVIMPAPVYIERVTIEHVPLRGSPDISAAPQHLELWISIPDAKLRDLVWQDVLTHTDAAGVAWSDVRPLADRAGEPSRGFFATLTSLAGLATAADSSAHLALPEEYVRVASWRYHINGPNHVQTIPVDADLEALGASARRAVVRATSNHGADYTCMYRVRAHGRTVEDVDVERQSRS